VTKPKARLGRRTPFFSNTNSPVTDLAKLLPGRLHPKKRSLGRRELPHDIARGCFISSSFPLFASVPERIEQKGTKETKVKAFPLEWALASLRLAELEETGAVGLVEANVVGFKADVSEFS
jgi:hypothetical protein